MCGITGFIGNLPNDSLEHSVKLMANSLRHRGPDDSGIWVDREYGVAFGHRRLSVLDLSPTGHQPMISASGRFITIFNGEIYNHIELRNQLSDNCQCKWKGHSDTETLLACFEVYGVEETLKHSVGMFAIAVWDRQERQLSLVRDRMGEKPLYYGWSDNGFVFGSELKALRQFPGFSNAISRDVLTLYFRYSYIPAPYSIYEGIFKLEPGCILTISLAGTSKPPAFIPHAPCENDGWALKRYWSLHEQVIAGQSAIIRDENEAISTLEQTIRESIRLQSIADVPLGAFLSGGVDSSLIVALMQSQAKQPVRTFTIGFYEAGYNEAEYAKAVAQHLQTEHTELYLNHKQAIDVIPLLPDLYDEPFADSSQIPAFLVAQMTNKHVTVALSGDAGDELFGGYNRYFCGPKIWNKISWLPYNIRQKLSTLLIKSSKIAGSQIGNCLLPNKLQDALLAEKMQKLGQRLTGVKDFNDFYLSLVSEWRIPEEIVVDGGKPKTLLTDRLAWPDLLDPAQGMMYLDSMTYLPDDILCKVDRAAMGVSLETRVPMLDHRIVALSWRLPLELKVRHGQGKWALRKILYKYVPRELIERPKQGFAMPLGQWLRGPLREWAEELLDPTRISREAYLRHEPILQKWEEHVTGKRNWEHSLWSVLMFQAWLEKQQEHS